jgi:hypothetical protein
MLKKGYPTTILCNIEGFAISFATIHNEFNISRTSYRREQTHRPMLLPQILPGSLSVGRLHTVVSTPATSATCICSRRSMGFEI